MYLMRLFQNPNDINGTTLSIGQRAKLYFIILKKYNDEQEKYYININKIYNMFGIQCLFNNQYKAQFDSIWARLVSFRNSHRFGYGVVIS